MKSTLSTERTFSRYACSSGNKDCCIILIIFPQFVKQQIPLESLFSTFCDCSQPLLNHVANDRVMNSVCEQLVTKITHTMSNDFLRNIATLENAKEKKAVDVQMSLRDELKCFASHALSRFQLILIENKIK